MLLYLSGPMTGRPDFNHEEFTAYATDLRNAGHVVISPHENFGGETGLGRTEYLRHDLLTILGTRPDGIAVMPDWWDSDGAVLEVRVAKAVGIPIYCAHCLVNPATDDAVAEAWSCTNADMSYWQDDIARREAA
ncbi:MAG: DUF4406 domain-containing protein [Gammaproteobacteria bacterium]